MRLCVLVTTLVVALVVGVASAQVSLGNERIVSGDYAGAVEAFETAVETNDRSAYAWLLLARSRTYLADTLPSSEADTRQALYASALEAAETAVALDPNEADAHMEVARAAGRNAQFQGVLNSINLAGTVKDALDRTLELEPDHGPALHALGLFHHEVPWIAGGRSRQVVPSFEAAIAAEPQRITHRVELAKILIAREETDAAREQLAAAIGIEPQSAADTADLEEAETLLASLP